MSDFEHQVRDALSQLAPPSELLVDETEVLQRGHRAVRNRRLTATASAGAVAAALALVVTQVAPQASTEPRPATHTSHHTIAPAPRQPTVRTSIGMQQGEFDFRLDRSDPAHPQIRYRYVNNDGTVTWTKTSDRLPRSGRDAVWTSGSDTGGRRLIVALLDQDVKRPQLQFHGTCAKGPGWSTARLEGTPYTALAVDCTDPHNTLSVEGIWWGSGTDAVGGVGFSGGPVHGTSQPLSPTRGVDTMVTGDGAGRRLWTSFYDRDRAGGPAIANSDPHVRALPQGGALAAAASTKEELLRNDANRVEHLVVDAPLVVTGALPTGAHDFTVRLVSGATRRVAAHVTPVGDTGFDAVTLTFAGAAPKKTDLASVSWQRTDGSTGTRQL